MKYFVEEENSNDLLKIQAENSPFVKFLNGVIAEAIQQQASDVHFEPFEDYYRIRFRIDGLLYERYRQPLTVARYITARLKILSDLDIAERRLPQDGRFKFSLTKDHTVDFRLNTCPTLNGEKAVLRLLKSQKDLIAIEHLGMTSEQLQLFTQTISQPQGMILVTGPTGSGKTVTLYAALNRLNTPHLNICSIEDPIEIYLPGINQVQVNLKTEFTFPTALRAFLRQDPDIIMVGEIRDSLTAETAVKAAQTGHLLLSTLHTNTAVETLIRLTTLQIPSYHILNSLLLIIAQRLVRCLCPHCKISVQISDKQLLQAGFCEQELNTLHLFESMGCMHCHQGYKNRLGIYEFLPISSSLAPLMRENTDINSLKNHVQLEHPYNLRRAGLEKVKAGVTSLSEINRVVPH